MEHNKNLTDITITFCYSRNYSRALSLLKNISGHKKLQNFIFISHVGCRNIFGGYEVPISDAKKELPLISRKLETFLKKLVVDSPFLKNLNLAFYLGFRNLFDDACLLASATTVLQSINLLDAHVSNRAVLRFVRKSPELREIKLPFENINDAVLMNLADFCPKLKTLNLRNCKYNQNCFHRKIFVCISFDTVLYVINKLRYLQDITFCLQSGRKFVQVIQAMTLSLSDVTHLDIKYNFHDTEKLQCQSLVPFLKKFVNLRSLQLIANGKSK